MIVRINNPNANSKPEWEKWPLHKCLSTAMEQYVLQASWPPYDAIWGLNNFTQTIVSTYKKLKQKVFIRAK